ncbi:MAG: response regulator [Rhodospirillales bacterium]|jgi:phosphoribosyl 1,2-cyclic phosphodiesterase/ActR/RegA family two-component response regulator|nr:response regulator [Rhodospirillales bacterium]
MKAKLKFFIVDDDEDIIGLQTAILESAGHRVYAETSGANALVGILKRKPDVILLDIMMPGMDGLELCRKVRENKAFRDKKIIFVSAKSYEFDRRRGLSFGADGFILKPIMTETFVDQIERIVEDHIEVAFWGVRGTLPVPGEKALRYGGNTSCVSLEFSKDRFFVFDGGSGIKALSDHLLAQGRTRLDAKIFISHPHWDHINALPFFGPMYIPGNEFEICGASHGDVTMRELISAQMDDVYFPITIKEFGSRVFFRDLREQTVEFGDIVVKTMLLSHPGYCLGYRVEYKGRSICYITDNELYLESDPSYNPTFVRKLKHFVEGTDVLITDTTYTDEEYQDKIGWGHSSVGQVVDLADDAKVKTLYLFHHDPDQSDDDIDAKWKAAVGQLGKRKSSTRCVAPAEGQRFKI